MTWARKLRHPLKGQFLEITFLNLKKIATLYPGGIRSHSPIFVSGDDTSRPRRHAKASHMYVICMSMGRKFLYTVLKNL
jgi:hypothetical protein